MTAKTSSTPAERKRAERARLKSAGGKIITVKASPFLIDTINAVAQVAERDTATTTQMFIEASALRFHEAFADAKKAGLDAGDAFSAAAKALLAPVLEEQAGRRAKEKVDELLKDERAKKLFDQLVASVAGQMLTDGGGKPK